VGIKFTGKPMDEARKRRYLSDVAEAERLRPRRFIRDRRSNENLALVRDL